MVKGIQYVLAVVVIALAAAGAAGLVLVRRHMKSDKLVLLSPNPETVKIEFARAFGRYCERELHESGGVEWLNTGGGTQDQLKYIKTQFGKNPQGIGVDLFWGGGLDPYLDLKNANLLMPFRPPKEVLAGIPPICAGMPVYDPDGLWYGTALSGFGIVYNKPLLRKMKLPEPKAWEDLTGPKLVSLVACGDPRKSGVTHMLLEIMLQGYGWEKGFEVITKLCANIRSFSDSSGLVPASVGLGESAYGLIIDFYAWAQIQKEGAGQIGFVMPEGLTVVTADGIGILRGAPHPKLARAFVDFVLSEEGQMLWLLPPGAPGGPERHGLNRISVLPSAYERCKGKATVTVRPSDFKTQMKYDSRKASVRSDVLNDLIGALFIDTHSDLVAAWKAVAARKMPPPLVKRLCAVPVTEAEVSDLATTKWQDSGFRNKKIVEWLDFARKRYYELAR